MPDLPAAPEPDLEVTTVAELREAMAAGDLTAVRLVEACIARIEALDRRGPSLHAVRAVDPSAVEQARRADDARRAGDDRPLLGIPVLVKDNIDVAGLPTTAGSLALAGHVPTADAPLVANLREAGAVVLGKANLTEWANFMTDDMPSGYSAVGGQVLNPYDTSVTPSGSSSGSAAAVAGGLAPLAIGTETNGSILSPANACSIVGVKPTVGLIPTDGVVPIASSQDVPGPMARTVADAAALLGALVGGGTRYECRSGGLAGARLGVADTPVPAGAEQVWAEAREVLVSRGAVLLPAALHAEPPDVAVLTLEFRRDLDAYLAGVGRDVAVHSLAEVVAWNEAHAAEELKFGQARLVASAAVDLDDPDTQRRYREARRADLEYSRERIDAVLAAASLEAIVFPAEYSSDLGARAGYPSVSVPAGYDRGHRRPVGLTFLGPARSEGRLLELAADFEAGAGARRPPSVVNPAAYRRS